MTRRGSRRTQPRLRGDSWMGAKRLRHPDGFVPPRLRRSTATGTVHRRTCASNTDLVLTTASLVHRGVDEARRPYQPARQMPDETPVDFAAHLAGLARDARDRLPSIVARIEGIVCAVDPIELLSQLSILNLTHPAGGMPDRDDKASWQVRIDWLAWLVIARQVNGAVGLQAQHSSVLGP